MLDMFTIDVYYNCLLYNSINYILYFYKHVNMSYINENLKKNINYDFTCRLYIRD